jgi:hypothetical protein
MRSRSLALTLLLALLLALPPSRASSTVELDASTLWTAISAAVETDLLVLFHHQPQAQATLALASTLSRRMKLSHTPSTILALYDLHLHGWPSGLHVHHSDDGAVILFPAGGREPHAYDWLHDPLSEWPSKGAAAAASAEQASVGADGSSSGSTGGAAAAAGAEEEEGGEEGGHHHHHHEHALAPSANGVLRWLKGGASSFPSDIPLVAISDLWEGREDGLFSAVLSGLEALHQRMSALQAENARLQLELDSCSKSKL